MSEYIVNVPDEEAECFIARFELENVKLLGYDLTCEIVRCKDCIDFANAPGWKYGACLEHDISIAPDDFCSCGRSKVVSRMTDVTNEQIAACEAQDDYDNQLISRINKLEQLCCGMYKLLELVGKPYDTEKINRYLDEDGFAQVRRYIDALGLLGGEQNE